MPQHHCIWFTARCRRAHEICLKPSYQHRQLKTKNNSQRTWDMFRTLLCPKDLVDWPSSSVKCTSWLGLQPKPSQDVLIVQLYYAVLICTTVNPKKLEAGCRTISAGIPYTLLLKTGLLLHTMLHWTALLKLKRIASVGMRGTPWAGSLPGAPWQGSRWGFDVWGLRRLGFRFRLLQGLWWGRST